MKKRELNRLQLNKASVSNLYMIHGGSEAQQDAQENNAGHEEQAFDLLSILKNCSKKRTCKRVCPTVM